jgi:MoaE-MoaD fusion protein
LCSPFTPYAEDARANTRFAPTSRAVMAADTMRVRVKLFAILRERAGESDVVLHLRPGARVADAAHALSDRFPDLNPFLPRVAFAVNQNYARGDTPLAEGDELALIPPVSGGRL